MLKSYFTVALRSLLRQKGYALINISGLAVGAAACLLILLFVQHELGYDQFHEGADRIYRATTQFKGGGREADLAVTPSLVSPGFQRNFPEVEAGVRLYNPGRYSPLIVQHEEVRYSEVDFLYADSTFLDVFSFAWVAGNRAEALTEPNTILLTESTAQKYFGEQDPIGKRLTVNGSRDFEVTGVLADVPSQSHFSFDFVASLVTRQNWPELRDDALRAANFFTYLKLREGANVAALKAKIPGFVEAYAPPPSSGMEVAINLQPLMDIHLRSTLDGEDIAQQGDIRYVYGFVAIALLILLIACINYMNLATARSARRAKEVGMRKALGAVRTQLARQFYAESALMTLLGMIGALLLVVLALPFFNAIIEKQLHLDTLMNGGVIATLVAMFLVITLVAGSYPALLLAAFKPVDVLKGAFKRKASGQFIRKGLVVFQFAVSVFLIAATLVVMQQVDFIRNTKLGFDKEQVVMLSISDRQLAPNYERVKSALLRDPRILQASAVSDAPGFVKGGYSISYAGDPNTENYSIIGMAADEDVVETLGLELVAGRTFPEGFDPEVQYYFMLNEAALRRMNLTPEEAVGREVSMNGRDGVVTGVLADFHFHSLRNQIQPLAVFSSPWDFDYLLVKLAPGDLPGTMSYLQQQWATLAPHRPFEYEFLDQAFDALYKSEVQVGRLFGSFAGIGILIACLGLFGLAAFTAEQRTKEIGVRKVLGATIPQIWALLSREFALLVLISFLVAAPIAYWVMQDWLAAFAYRIDLGLGLFLLAGGAAFAIALLTISYQALRAAWINPVEALRYE